MSFNDPTRGFFCFFSNAKKTVHVRSQHCSSGLLTFRAPLERPICSSYITHSLQSSIVRRTDIRTKPVFFFSAQRFVPRHTPHVPFLPLQGRPEPHDCFFRILIVELNTWKGNAILVLFLETQPIAQSTHPSPGDPNPELEKAQHEETNRCRFPSRRFHFSNRGSINNTRTETYMGDAMK